MSVKFEQQQHGYSRGHQLLVSSVKLEQTDQEAIDRLSDLSGSLAPNENFQPYVSGYPLPSGRYYVLARTWQDRFAPRAGCVLTHSILMAPDDWAGLRSISQVLELFHPFDRALEGPRDAPSITIEPREEWSALPSVADPRCLEVLEALFLEERQPIVWLNAIDPETTAHRLLLAFWPALRRRFSFCTYALSPRSIAGRDFDLLFAPMHARIRFSDWQGRRIEPAAAPPGPRHRWSAQLAERVFLSPRPSLLDSDPLGIVLADESGDSGALRLSYLWADLQESLKTSPTAILGLFDVLSSQRLSRAVTDPRLRESLATAIKNILISVPGPEALAILGALLQKALRTPAGQQLIGDIANGIAKVIQREPITAIGLLAKDGSDATSNLLVRAAAAGLLSASPSVLRAVMQRLSPSIVASLLASETRLAGIAMAEPENAPDAWWGSLVRAADLQHAQDTSVAKSLISNVRHPAHCALLRGIVRELQAEIVGDAVKCVWRGDAAAEPALVAALLDTARGPGLERLREELSLIPDRQDVDDALARSLEPKPRVLEWIANSTQLSPARRTYLALALLNKAAEEQLPALSRSRAFPVAGEVLLQEPEKYASLWVRLLPHADLGGTDALRVFDSIFPILDRHRQVEALSVVLPTLVASELPVERITQYFGMELMPLVLEHVGSRQALSWFRYSSPATASNAIQILANAHTDLRALAQSNIIPLSEEWCRTRANLGEPAYTAWARLLADSEENSFRSSVRANALAFEYCLEHTEWPVGDLIVTAFPAVHSAVGAGSYVYEVAKFYSFLDWDRPSVVRRLYFEAFLNSGWPPHLLVVGAERAGVVDKVVRSMMKSNEGGRFISRAEADLETRGDARSSYLLDCLLRAKQDAQ